MGSVEKIRGFRQGKQLVSLGLKNGEEGPSSVTSQKFLPLDESGYLTVEVPSNISILLSVWLKSLSYLQIWKKKEKIYLELLNFYLPLNLTDNFKTAVFRLPWQLVQELGYPSWNTCSKKSPLQHFSYFSWASQTIYISVTSGICVCCSALVCKYVCS